MCCAGGGRVWGTGWLEHWPHLGILSGFLQGLRQVPKDQTAAQLEGSSLVRLWLQLGTVQRECPARSRGKAGDDGTTETQEQAVPSAFLFSAVRRGWLWGTPPPPAWNHSSLNLCFILRLCLINVQKLTLNKCF